eukprot:6987705-Prymnesium_polylepis.3
MLFSGLGPDAQEQMSVGVGALAGSTIMLLTVPWGLAIFAGSVPVGAAGHALYGKKAIAAEKQKIALRRAKTSSLSTSKGLWGYGVTPEATIKENAGIMVATSLCYLIIQGPAFQYAKSVSAAQHREVLRARAMFSAVASRADATRSGRISVVALPAAGERSKRCDGQGGALVVARGLVGHAVRLRLLYLRWVSKRGLSALASL